MRNMVTLAASTAVVAVLAASSANAATFVGSYTASVNSSDPGLVLNIQDLAGGLNFVLNNAGDSLSVNLFNLYTNEASVNPDDQVAKAASVAFNFTLPTVFTGSVPGQTDGDSFFYGLYQQGHVTWSGPQILNFGNGGQLKVSLNDATFNSGVFGLDKGPADGATITAKFELVSAAVPEPATWAMMIAGFGMAGAAIRRRRATTVAA